MLCVSESVKLQLALHPVSDPDNVLSVVQTLPFNAGVEDMISKERSRRGIYIRSTMASGLGCRTEVGDLLIQNRDLSFNFHQLFLEDGLVFVVW